LRSAAADGEIVGGAIILMQDGLPSDQDGHRRDGLEQDGHQADALDLDGSRPDS
jgi:hypothetical protein